MITDPCYLHQQNHFNGQDLPAPTGVRFCRSMICKGVGFISALRIAVQDCWGSDYRISLTHSPCLLRQPFLRTESYYFNFFDTKRARGWGFSFTSGQYHFKVYAKEITFIANVAIKYRIDSYLWATSLCLNLSIYLVKNYPT